MPSKLCQCLVSVTVDNFATVKPDQTPSNNEISVRISPVLSGFSKQDGIFDYKPGDEFKIKTLGIEDETFKFKNWLYNNSVKYTISIKPYSQINI